MKTYHKGFIAPLLLALIALLILGGGAYVYVQNKQSNQPATTIPTTQSKSTPPVSTRSSSFTATPTSGIAPLTVSFDSVTLDPDATNLYEVDFGDNSKVTGSMQETRCAGECRKFTVVHTYATSGKYTARLIADSNSPGAKYGGVYINTATITVSAPTPHIISATVTSGPSSDFIQIVGTGFADSPKVHVSGRGFNDFVETDFPGSNRPISVSTDGSTLYLFAAVPASYKSGDQYTVYVKNGDNSVSNTLTTPTPSQG